MMRAAELRNRTLVAAVAAKQSGFTYTYEALLEIVQGIEDAPVNGIHLSFFMKHKESSSHKHSTLRSS